MRNIDKVSETFSILAESEDNFELLSYSTETWGNEDFVSYTDTILDMY